MYQFRWWLTPAAIALAFAVPVSRAAQVNLVGLFPEKALVEIDGGRPRVVSVGQKTPEGVTLLSTASDSALFDIDGRRTSIRLGQSAGSKDDGGDQRAGVTLSADGSGHFIGLGSINGASARFLVDTGATTVAMSISEARRLGIDYLGAQVGATATAAGVVRAYRVSLDSVKVGGLMLNQVDGTIIDAPGMPFVLLGMSFLSRVEMRRDGTTMTLTKRY